MRCVLLDITNSLAYYELKISAKSLHYAAYIHPFIKNMSFFFGLESKGWVSYFPLPTCVIGEWLVAAVTMNEKGSQKTLGAW